jgi:hypothetical protein
MKTLLGTVLIEFENTVYDTSFLRPEGFRGARGQPIWVSQPSFSSD